MSAHETSPAPTEGYAVIGTHPPRVDAVEKVTGQARYGPDVSLPGLLYGKVLRSPHAHARIRSIDTSRAKDLPGVHAVVTAQDLPGAEDRAARSGEGDVDLKYLCDNTLASDKVLYVGQQLDVFIDAATPASPASTPAVPGGRDNP